MKKIIISILMLCICFASTTKAGDTDLSNLDNVIYVESLTINLNEANVEGGVVTTTLSICMKNTAPIRGFQFNLYLPDGVTPVKTNKGKIKATLSEGRLDEEDDHTLSVSEHDDGSLLFLCGDEFPEDFLGTEGEVATLTVHISADMAGGAYTILLKNVKMTETDISKFYEVPEVKSTLTIENNGVDNSKKGDVNGDKEVNGIDIVSLVNVIMKDKYTDAADVNGDGEVNGLDIVALVNIIMKTTPSRSTTVSESVSTNKSTSAVIEAHLTPAETAGGQELAISLANPQMDVTMVQMDVTLPEGVSLENDEVLMCGRTTLRSHSLHASHLDERTVRLLLASGNNALIDGTQGDIIRIPLSVSRDFRGGDIVLDNMLCASPDLSEVRPQALILHISESGTMAVGTVSTTNESTTTVHNLTGQRLVAPRKGVNIVNGKKVIRKQ